MSLFSTFRFFLAVVVVVSAEISPLTAPVNLNGGNDGKLAPYEGTPGPSLDAGFVQSKEVPTLCMHAEQGLIVGSLIQMATCTLQSTQFRWSRDTQQMQVASHPELCVDLTSNSEPISVLLHDDGITPTNTLLQLQPCVAGSKSQEFLVGSSIIKNKARPDLCIGSDASSLKANSTTSQLEVEYCKSVEKSQNFRYVAAEDMLDELKLVKALEEKHHSEHHHAGQKGHSGHSTEVGASGHVKHAAGRKPTDGKILSSLDIMDNAVLMRRSGSDGAQQDPKAEGAAHVKAMPADFEKHAEIKKKSEVEALLERISDGLTEDEDDEDLTAEELDSMLDKAVVSKDPEPTPPPVPPKINCAWGKWGKWSSCTADCGGGTQDRSRGERIPAENNGLMCDGEAEEEKQCNKVPCVPPGTPVTPPPAAASAAPMMAKGGAPVTVTLAPAVLVVMLLASCQSLRSFQ